MKSFTFGLGLSAFSAVTFFGPANGLVAQIYTNYNKRFQTTIWMDF